MRTVKVNGVTGCGDGFQSQVREFKGDKVSTIRSS